MGKPPKRRAERKPHVAHVSGVPDADIRQVARGAQAEGCRAIFVGKVRLRRREKFLRGRGKNYIPVVDRKRLGQIQERQQIFDRSARVENLGLAD